LHPGVPRAGTRVLYRDENGAVVAWTCGRGKGRVVTTAVRRSLPDALNAPVKFGSPAFNAARLSLLNGSVELTLLRELLTTVQGETIPVKVDGDIQWGVNIVVGESCSGRKDEDGHSPTPTQNSNSKSYLVWLVNNKGVVKFIGEPQELDPKKAATVALSMRNVKDPSAYVFRDADTGSEIDPKAVTVGPGDVRFITVSRVSTRVRP